MKDLLLNGYMIYSVGEKFAVKKEFVPMNQSVFPETFYDSYEEAFLAAKKMLNTPKILIWTAIMRYNRGLGIEYRNLPNIQATTKEEAEIIAKKIAEETINDDKTEILEIKLRVNF
jgi:hypothetical protein